MDETQLPDLKYLVGAKTDGSYRDQDGHVQQYLHPHNSG